MIGLICLPNGYWVGMDSDHRLKATQFQGVYRDDGRFYTRNLVPGVRVYGERLLADRDEEYREWMHTRSKLAAYLKSGGHHFPFEKGTQVLYLGAASGTTASHLSDIVVEGTIYCVEISPRSFRDLVRLCDARSNMAPILGDATQPASFSFAVGEVDVVYQDVAQRGQAAILTRNMEQCGAMIGLLALKSRSEDVSKPPAKVYKEAESGLRERGYRVREVVALDPYERDHAMMVVEPR